MGIYRPCHRWMFSAMCSSSEKRDTERKLAEHAEKSLIFLLCGLRGSALTVV
jgi:hypothetical protein